MMLVIARAALRAAVVVSLTAMAAVRAVDDRPPELEAPQAPDELPPLEAPQPAPRGTATIQFAGATAFTDEKLREAIARQITTIEELGLNEASAYDAAFFLEVFYRKSGYPFVSVAWRITGALSLALDIKEGPSTTVGSVSFRGNKQYDSDTLKKYLLGPTRERFPRIREETALPFVEADVRNGVDLVRRLYAADGYLDAVINEPRVSFTADLRSARVSVTIKEGIQYRFGHVTLKGESFYAPESLMAEINDEVSQPFTEGRLAAAQRKLEDYYKTRGHFTAAVDASASKESAVKGRVPVTFTLRPGPVYHFDGITVQGTDRLAPEFLEKRFANLAGQTYDPALIDKHFREMIQTGLFRHLRINPVPVPGELLRLDLEVEEAKAKEFSFGAGVGSFEGGFVSLGYADRNLFGSGRPFRFSAEWSSRGYKGEATYSDPWLFDTDYSFNLRLYALTRDLDDYEKQEYGFHPTLSRKFNDHWEWSVFALAKHVSIESSQIDPPELLGPPDYWVHSIGISQKVDFRNNKVNPSRGFLWVTTFDAGLVELGSDIAFLRGTMQFSYYVPVTKNSVLALGARGGLISPGGDGLVPIDERFFNGGATTVRSFRERQLGPTDARGHPIGGEAFTVFNAEYTFPIRGDLKGAIFADAGNVHPKAADFGHEDMRYAVGIGLRYVLPVGAIRVDYGLNPSPREGESSGAFHFSIGVAF
jgi:outer membrane protein insertion porin family